jgi:hypothetical protein
MRCLFTMFAEDVQLLPHESFRNLLLQYADRPDVGMRMLAQLWRDMDGGGFSTAIACDVLRFNGKLFKQPDTLPLSGEQITLLSTAAKANWEHVEPAIFGTLLERALDTTERHKLGARYAPRLRRAACIADGNRTAAQRMERCPRPRAGQGRRSGGTGTADRRPAAQAKAHKTSPNACTMPWPTPPPSCATSITVYAPCAYSTPPAAVATFSTSP